MTSYYLTRPLIPLAVALPRMLEKIETKLAHAKIGAAEKWRLRLRAGLIRAIAFGSGPGGATAFRNDEPLPDSEVKTFYDASYEITYLDASSRLRLTKAGRTPTARASACCSIWIRPVLSGLPISSPIPRRPFPP